MTISIVRAVICHMSEREGDDERPGAGGRRPGERRRHCTTDGVHHSDQREAHQPVGHGARQGIRGRADQQGPFVPSLRRSSTRFTTWVHPPANTGES